MDSLNMTKGTGDYVYSLERKRRQPTGELMIDGLVLSTKMKTNYD